MGKAATLTWELQECTAQKGDLAAWLGWEPRENTETTAGRSVDSAESSRPLQGAVVNTHLSQRGRKKPRKRKELAQTYTSGDYKKKLLGELALKSCWLILIPVLE